MIELLAQKVAIKDTKEKLVKINVCLEQYRFSLKPHKIIRHKPSAENIRCARTKTHSESTHIPILNGGRVATRSQKLVAIKIDRLFSKNLLIFFMAVSCFFY